MLICLPYDNTKIYPFWCSRYENIKYEEYLKIGYEEFMMKLNSVPKDEPLYEMFKARAININKIKDKEEKKYWRELKKAYAIPDEYKPIEILNKELKEQVKTGVMNNGK